jgi:hypothetical protein
MPQSSVRNTAPAPGAAPLNKTGKKKRARRSRTGLYGLLKGWTVDSQALSNELKD